MSFAIVSFSDKQSKADYSLFVKRDDASFTSVVVYTDNLFITSNNPEAIAHLKAQLSSHFHMKDLDELSYFFALEVSKSSQGLFVSHKKYTLAFFSVISCSPLSTHQFLTNVT